MLRMRREKRRTSLDRLAAVTGKNKATIRKYEKEEIHIPPAIALKLAEEYFDDPKERRRFMEVYRAEIVLRQAFRWENRARKKERTIAGRKFEAVLRISAVKGKAVTETATAMHFATKYSYQGTAIIVDLVDKSTRSVVCSIFPGQFYVKTSSDKWMSGNAAVKAYIVSSRLRGLGLYALMDLAREKILRSDIFKIGKYETGESGKGRKVFLVESEIVDRLVHIIDSTNKSPREAMYVVKIHLNYLRSRGNEVSAIKEKLLARVDSVIATLSRYS